MLIKLNIYSRRNKMKRFSKVMVVLAALLLGCAFIGCENGSSSGGGKIVAGARVFNLKEITLTNYEDPDDSSTKTKTTFTSSDPEWNDLREIFGSTVYYKDGTYSLTGAEGSFKEEEDFIEFLKGITSNKDLDDYGVDVNDVGVLLGGDDILIDVGNLFENHLTFDYDWYE